MARNDLVRVIAEDSALVPRAAVPAPQAASA
jgi:hypothetical protein